MKQVVQSLNGGQLSLAAVPPPLARPGTVVIANVFSLISAGTEKTAMELAHKSLLGKARERPDHVRRVLEKVRNEGLLNIVAQVQPDFAWLGDLSAFRHAGVGTLIDRGTADWVGIGLFTLVAVAGWTASLVLFRRRDLLP